MSLNFNAVELTETGDVVIKGNTKTITSLLAAYSAAGINDNTPGKPVVVEKGLSQKLALEHVNGQHNNVVSNQAPETSIEIGNLPSPIAGSKISSGGAQLS